MALEEHRAAAPAPAAVYVVTLSDTRQEATDEGGAAVRAAVHAAGHSISGWRIVREEAAGMRREFEELLAIPDYDVLIVTGGTGIAPRDLAFDTLDDLYDRPVPGFGELFRVLSYAEIGAAAMLSRASAGIARGKLVFSIPGAPAAVRLALHKLILPELGHMLGEVRRTPDTERPH